MIYEHAARKTRDSVLGTNKVIRNTYILLSATLIFSAIAAFYSMAINAASLNIFIFLIGAYGLMFLTHKFSNSPWGILCVFAFSGFMGYSLGPMLNMYLSLANGGETIMLALGMTGVVFFSLSGYALTTRKDFNFLTGFLSAGVIVLLASMLINIFFSLPGLHLAISAGFVLFSSALILYETSRIIHGGQTNYIIATIGLYVAIYNLFVSLLNLLGLFNRN